MTALAWTNCDPARDRHVSVGAQGGPVAPLSPGHGAEMEGRAASGPPSVFQESEPVQA